MDYAKQSTKEHPFDGLTQEEKKRLLVYMCHVAHPCLSPDEIERKYGEVLPKTESPTVFEALEIAADIKREIKEASSLNPKSPPKPDPPGGDPTNVLLAIILLILAVAAICCFGRYSYVKEKANRREQRRQIQESYRRRQQQEVDSLRKEYVKLKESVEGLLAGRNVTAKEWLNMGGKVQAILEQYSKVKLEESDSATVKLPLKELMLKCYKKAKSVDNGKVAAEAAYRIALLYLPPKYRIYLKEVDSGVVLSENEDVSMEHLKHAANHRHYKALSLISKIPWFQNNSLSLSEIHRYKEDLASHPDATDDDIYGYLDWLLKMGSSTEAEAYMKKLASRPNATTTDIYNYAKRISESLPDESRRFMRKAAKMGDSRARQALLDEGLTIDE